MNTRGMCLMVIAVVMLVVAQTSVYAGNFVVGVSGNTYFQNWVSAGYTLETSLDDAIAAAIASPGSLIILPAQGAGTAYNVSTNTFNKDENFTIRGFPPNAPENVVIKTGNSGEAVFSTAAGPNSTAAIILEGVTLSGGSTGFDAGGKSSVTLNRCYIIGASRGTTNVQTAGVRCGGSATVKLTSCSVSANDGNGIDVQGGGNCTITNCSIIANNLSGVLVETGGGTSSSAPTATLLNNLIYDNAHGSASPAIISGCDEASTWPSPGWTLDGDWMLHAPLLGSGGPPGFGNPDPATVAPVLNPTPTTKPCTEIFGTAFGKGNLGNYSYTNTAPSTIDFLPGPPQTILPNTNTLSVSVEGAVNVPSSNIDIIGDLNVHLNIILGAGRHNSQLGAVLAHVVYNADGTVKQRTDVTLFNEGDVGNGSINFGKANAGGVVLDDVILDDEASVPITAGTGDLTDNGGGAWLLNRYAPRDKLSAFDGDPLAGDWTLTLTGDDSSGLPLLNDALANTATITGNWTGTPNGSVPPDTWSVDAKNNDYHPNTGTATPTIYTAANVTPPPSPMPPQWTDYEFWCNIVCGSDYNPSIKNVCGVIFRADASMAGYYLLQLTTDPLTPAATYVDLLTVSGGVATEVDSFVRRPYPEGFLVPGLSLGAGTTIPVNFSITGSTVTLVTLGTVAVGGFIPALPDLSNSHPQGSVGFTSNTPTIGFNAALVKPAITPFATINDWFITVSPRRYLTSPPLDFSMYTGVEMDYARSLNVFGPPTWALSADALLAGAFIEASSDGKTNWTTVWDAKDEGGTIQDNPGNNGNQWTFQVLANVSSYLDGQPSAKVRWGYFVDELAGLVTPSKVASGWNVDQIEFHALGTGSWSNVGGLVVTSPKATVTNTYDYVYGQDPNFYPSTLAATETIDPAALSNPDPGVLGPNPWWGDLDDTTALTNPLAGKGSAAGMAPLAFEDQQRATPPYIGADELSLTGLEIPLWLDCHVWVGSVSAQEVNQPVRKANAGDLHIGILTNAVGSLDTNAIQVWFQGADDLHYIHTTLQSSDGAFYTFVNTDPVATSYEHGDTPAFADHLEDGNAVVRLLTQVYGELFICTDPTLGAIPGAAQRINFLIDTIPPKVMPLDITTQKASDYFWLKNQGQSGFYPAAMGVPWGTAFFPYPNPGVIMQQLDQYGYLDLASCVPFRLNPDGSCTAFYNTGSISDGYNALVTQMLINICPTVIDQTVFDRFTYLQTRADNGTRPMSGFDDFSGTKAVTAAAPQLLTGTYIDAGNVTHLLPAYWDKASWPFADTATFKTTTLATSGGAPSKIQADWYFSDASGNEIGITPPVDLNVQGTFCARDRAGNSSAPADSRSAGLYRFGQFPPDKDKLAAKPHGKYFDVTWNGPQSDKIDPTAPPGSWYTHKFFMATTAGRDNPTGPYKDIGIDWTAWTNLPGLTPSDFDGMVQTAAVNGVDVSDHYVLVVVGMMDVAGNVSGWPFFPAVSPDITLPGGDAGPGWCRVYIGGSNLSCDTTLSVDLYYSDPPLQPTDLGAVTMVPYPQSATTAIMMNLTMGLVVVNQADLPYSLVRVTVDQDGQNVFDGEVHALPAPNGVPQPSPSRTLTLPFSGTNTPPMNVTPVGASFSSWSQIGNRDPNDPQKAPTIVKYVVRAYTEEYYPDPQTGLPVWLMNDNTPANFSFSVVPQSVDAYLNSNSGGGGQQPIKSFETK